MNMRNAIDSFTTRDLVRALVAQLTELWPNFKGYAFAYPEPQMYTPAPEPAIPPTRAPQRVPFFVVMARSGAYGLENASVDISIILEVFNSDEDGEGYVDAIQTLHNAIDALALEMYRDPVGFFCGAKPGAISWNCPESALRPVWEAQINITFEMPVPTNDNGNWLN